VLCCIPCVTQRASNHGGYAVAVEEERGNPAFMREAMSEAFYGDGTINESEDNTLHDLKKSICAPHRYMA